MTLPRSCVSRYPTLVLILALSLTVGDARARQRLEPSHLRDVVHLADPQISPDGRSVAVTAVRADWEENRWVPQLLLVDPKTRETRPLTFDRPSIRNVRWAPDGLRLAFLAPDADGRDQVFVLPMMGGGEARQATRSPSSIRRFEWSPSGTYFLALVEEETPEKTEAGRHLNAFVVGNNDYLTTSPPRSAHLWLVPALAAADSRRLTHGPGTVGSFDWAPNGRWAAYEYRPTPFPGDSDQGSIYLLEVETGELRSLTEGMRGASRPLFSPDSRYVTFAWPRDGDPSSVVEVYAVAVDGGEAKSLTRMLDRNVRQVSWINRGSLLVGGPDGTSWGLWLQSAGGEARPLELEDVHGISDLHLGRLGEVAYVGTPADRPAELFFREHPHSKATRLTSFHDEIAKLDLGRAETIEWEGPDGLRADGVVVRPPDFSEDRKYPLVLVIHGGPTSVSTEGFSSLAQLMAARGWVVFQPNYRGSEHRGNEFQSAIRGDGAEGPGRDVMAGLEALKARGFVDEERIAVSGWSYGGYMTAWLLGRYPGVWRAAVAGAAPVDVTDMTSLSDLNVRLRHAITSSPWVGENYRAYYEMSPMAHFSKIRTPTLVMSKTGDTRVTVTGSYKLFHALRANGVEVEFVAYPGPGHFPSDPVNAEDVYRRWIDWIARHFGDDEEPSTAPKTR